MIIKTTSSKYFQSINPYTHEVIEKYDVLSHKIIKSKLDSAAKTYPIWKNIKISERIVLVENIQNYLIANKESLSLLITTEMGKTMTESRAEIDKCALVCSYYNENIFEFMQNEKVDSEINHYISYSPIGAVVAVMPWNFPFWQVFRCAINIILTGNVFILKHAPNVCGCALEIENIFRKCGFPENVFTTLIIDIKDLPKVIKNPLVQGVTLTGSEKAGRSFASLAGKNLVKSVLELGGSDACLFLDDADFEMAARESVKSRMQNAGQSCISAKRFFVSKQNHERLVELMKISCERITIGNPLDSKVLMGPMARIDLVNKLVMQQKNATEKGAKVISGGTHDNSLFTPTLLTNNSIKSAVFNDEIFGPMACVFVVENEQKMIELANQSNYGLGASIWTKDIEKGKIMAEKIEVGNVYINKMVKSDPSLPFGGIKNSGYGKELAKEGLRTFVNAKTIVF